MLEWIVCAATSTRKPAKNRRSASPDRACAAKAPPATPTIETQPIRVAAAQLTFPSDVCSHARPQPRESSLPATWPGRATGSVRKSQRERRHEHHYATDAEQARADTARKTERDDQHGARRCSTRCSGRAAGRRRRPRPARVTSTCGRATSRTACRPARGPDERGRAPAHRVDARERDHTGGQREQHRRERRADGAVAREADEQDPAATRRWHPRPDPEQRAGGARDTPMAAQEPQCRRGSCSGTARLTSPGARSPWGRVTPRVVATPAPSAAAPYSRRRVASATAATGSRERGRRSRNWRLLTKRGHSRRSPGRAATWPRVGRLAAGS